MKSNEALKRYRFWLKNVKNEALLAELKKMEANASLIEDSFYKELEFGTAGLRGVIGAGSNCLNVYTIIKTTTGVCNYMKKMGYKSVSISYDSRINSNLFAAVSALVFAKGGIKVFITKELMPVPFLSFLVRHKKTDMGIMITASHNPSKYNGYKVYGFDGCQLTDKAAEEVTKYISSVCPFSLGYSTKDFSVAVPYNGKIDFNCLNGELLPFIENGSIEIVDEAVEAAFLQELKKQNLHSAKGVKVVYSPLNGAGYRLVPAILKQIGLEDLFFVKEQQEPDGRFTTCSYPNPEKKQALMLALEEAKKTNADIVLATDPDADRMGVAVNCNNDFVFLTGNEMGVLLCDYIFSLKKKKLALPKNPLLIKTIVSTTLAEKVALEYGAKIENVLTGFKYIGEKIGVLEAKGKECEFVFGFEESYGYLAGTHARDKDAVVASMLAVEMASYYKSQNKTLVERLHEIYKTHGTYRHKLLSRLFEGAQGAKKMAALIENFRSSPPKSIANKKIEGVIDYLTQTKFSLPRANVIQLFLEGGCEIIIRPSGTEPLIKIYLTTQSEDEEEKLQAQMEEFFS